MKRDLFRRLDATCQPGAILASNTSSISITVLAAATTRPERVIGMHFFNPVPMMALVEIVRGARTSDATYDSGRCARAGARQDARRRSMITPASSRTAS